MGKIDNNIKYLGSKNKFKSQKNIKQKIPESPKKKKLLDCEILPGKFIIIYELP